jgi:hypothetical protein
VTLVSIRLQTQYEFWIIGLRDFGRFKRLVPVPDFAIAVGLMAILRL